MNIEDKDNKLYFTKDENFLCKELPNSIDKIDGEIWKKIDKSNYFVSNIGRVIAYKKTHDGKNNHFVKKILKKQKLNLQGYLYVRVKIGEKITRWMVHQLVAKHFVDGKKENYVVHHMNHNKTDNRASNLRWVTQETNIQLAIFACRFDPIINPYFNKRLKQDEIDEIKKLREKGYTINQISKELDLKPLTIKRICKIHCKEFDYLFKPREISYELRKEIISKFKRGFSFDEIQNEYKLNLAVVNKLYDLYLKYDRNHF